MKKVLTVLLSTVLLLSLTACQSPASVEEKGPLIMVAGDPGYVHDKVQVYAERLDWSDEKISLQVTWTNSTNYDAIFGASYVIERLEGEEWVSCAVSDNMSFIDLAYELSAGQLRRETYNLTGRYDVSVLGTYRFRSECYIHSDTGESTTQEVISRFYIKNEDGALSSEHTDIGSLDSFSFSFTWNVLGISSYDSTTGKLVKSSHATNPDDYITTYILTNAQKEKIYNLIASLDITSYPDQYDPHNGEGFGIPPTYLILSVQTNTTEKSISTTGFIFYDAENSRGQNFLNVCYEIINILTATEEWQALPDYEFHYL